VDLLAAAICSLPEAARKRLHLLFVGDGPLRAQVEQQLAASPAVSASFAGFQNQDTLASYYQAADLLVLPSRERETWGVVVNEALLNGLPCIVSDRVGCHPDLIKPGVTGEVCPANDVQGLAQSLQSLLTRVPSASTSEHCRELAARYSVSAAAEGIAKAWRSLPQP
jgi:glycosyltransferase involved in cell wall biosynthesis